MLKLKIQGKEGYLPDEQRLVVSGHDMHDSDTLAACNIEDGDTIQLILRLRGMISTWTTINESMYDAISLVDYLLLTDSRRESKGPITPNRINAMLNTLPESQHAPPSDERLLRHTIRMHQEHRLMSSVQRQRCMLFLERVWTSEIASRPSLTDLKVKFASVDAVAELLNHACPEDAEHNPNAASDLLALHPKTCLYGSLLEPMLALRLTRGPVAGCIGFHTDGNRNHTTSQIQTAQLTLNSDTEYDGGRICFVTERRLSIPRRPAGCLTTHSNFVVHAVTKLHGGSRYALFVLDSTAGLGDDQVVTVTAADVLRVMADPDPSINFQALEHFVVPSNQLGDSETTGALYSGRWLGQAVAIQVMESQHAPTPAVRAQFERDVQALYKVRHPRLLPLLGASTDDRLSLVYDLRSHGQLRALLNASPGSLPWRRRLAIMVHLFEGLVFLHDKLEMVHQGVKSSNIFLGRAFTARLGGIGMPRLFQQDSALTTQVSGTDGYATTDHVSMQADVYSAGVVVAELLSSLQPIDMAQNPPTLAARFLQWKENQVPWAKFGDTRVEWPPTLLERLATLTCKLLVPEDLQRPTSVSVLTQLGEMVTELVCPLQEQSLSPSAPPTPPVLCYYCEESLATTALVPCGHVCLCVECPTLRRLRWIHDCPVCHEPIEGAPQHRADDDDFLFASDY